MPQLRRATREREAIQVRQSTVRFEQPANAGFFVRTCARCETEKPTAEFAPRTRRGRRPSLDCYCRPCRREYQLEWQQANRERLRAATDRWGRENPATLKAAGAHYRSQRRAGHAADDLTTSDIAAMFEATTTCSECGHTFADLSEKSIDHIRPLGDGGRHERANVRVICRPCNSARAKSRREPA